MHRLDDRAFVERLDPSGMYRLTVAFPDQCREALNVAEALDLDDLAFSPNAVVLAGLGGSAAGGDLTRALFEAEGGVPFCVNRDYAMPNYVGESTLVFAVSYSGNTEETLAAYEDAKSRGAKIIAVTTGGSLADLASQDGFPVVNIPGGQPPRTALGLLFVPVRIRSNTS
ncbi:MAG: SIS domain-containing protein [Armatimonadetes bacterium]|nr:SIS domain-containing protein [Armatimonadota bacterium]